MITTSKEVALMHDYAVMQETALAFSVAMMLNEIGEHAEVVTHFVEAGAKFLRDSVERGFDPRDAYLALTNRAMSMVAMYGTLVEALKRVEVTKQKKEEKENSEYKIVG